MIETTLVQWAFHLLGHPMPSQTLLTLQQASHYSQPLTSAPCAKPTATMHDPHQASWQCVVICLIMHWGLISLMLPSLSTVVICVIVWVVNINGPSGLVAKYLTTLFCFIGWGRVSTYAWTVIQSQRVRFFHVGSPISLAKLFGVFFNGPSKGVGPCLEPWVDAFWCLHFHSSLGMAAEEIKLPGSISRHHMDTKYIYSSSFLCDLEANLAHLGRSVSAAFLCFTTRYCINAPKCYAVFDMQKWSI